MSANEQSPQKPKKRRPGPLPRVDKATVELALRKCVGNMSAAAKQLKVSRVTVWKYVRRSPDLQKLIEEIQEETIDIAESQLVKLLKERKHRGHTQAVLFVLKTMGRRRGYVERTELTGPPKEDGTPTNVGVVVYLPEIDPEG